MLRGWISGKKAALSASSTESLLDSASEAQNLEAAMKAVANIMSDDLEAAEEGLKQGNSSFHTLGRGMITFLRAALGFEPEIMREASERLAEAEAQASTDQRRAQRGTQSFRSSIYEPGAEFALCHAESQLMSAVVAVLNESLSESIKGFYKLRKAYMTLDSIVESEARYMNIKGETGNTGDTLLQRDSSDSRRSVKATGSTGNPAGATGGSIQHSSTSNDSATRDSDLVQEDVVTRQEAEEEGAEFHEAREGPEKGLKDADKRGLTKVDGVGKNLSEVSLNASLDHQETPGNPSELPNAPTQQMLSHDPDSEIFANPMDAFIHSGANLCYGMLLLLISMIPPAFGKLLFIIGFRGDRERGLRMLWQASKFHNVNGAMAGLIVLGYYNGFVGYCDVLPDASPGLGADSIENVEGYPLHRLETLLVDMRSRHPSSYLWLLEEARMQASRRNLQEGTRLLSGEKRSPLKQVNALSVFERSLQMMYAHRYEDCANSFVECCSLNNWSHALYYYISGSAHVELYRMARQKPDEVAAKSHSLRATELFAEVRSHAGKKKFMARQLPFDTFVVRKLNKWDARAKEWGVPFIDAVGVSPIEEMIYLWNGHKKMNPSQLSASLEALAWSDDPGRNPNWMYEGLDEKAILHLLRAANFRALERFDDAMALLKSEILNHDRASFKGALKDDWTCPVAHYEMGANLWLQRDRKGPQASQTNRATVRQSQEWIVKGSKWESYELDARFGLKVATAVDTLKRWRSMYDA